MKDTIIKQILGAFPEDKRAQITFEQWNPGVATDIVISFELPWKLLIEISSILTTNGFIINSVYSLASPSILRGPSIVISVQIKI